jgi:hypothetical protein
MCCTIQIRIQWPSSKPPRSSSAAARSRRRRRRGKTGNRKTNLRSSLPGSSRAIPRLEQMCRLFIVSNTKNIHKALNNNSGDSVERDCLTEKNVAARGGQTKERRRSKARVRVFFSFCVCDARNFLCFLVSLFSCPSVLSKKKTSFRRPTKRLHHRAAQHAHRGRPAP